MKTSKNGLAALFDRRAARCVLILALAYSSLTVPASALECPMLQKLAGPGVLKETQTQTDATAKKLSSGDVGNEVQAIVADLRRRYPNVENAELVDYIVAAHCPVVAGLASLSEAERKEKMDGFVRQLMQKVY